MSFLVKMWLVPNMSLREVMARWLEIAWLLADSPRKRKYQMQAFKYLLE
jgi:hypothetical protein